MIRRLLALPLLAVAAFSAPASAQDQAGDRVRMAIVYGDDEVSPPQGDEIVVVARLPEAERYRIPEALRFSDDPENMAWGRRVERLDLVGNFGTMSCSTAGAGGFTGCTQQLINAFYADKREGADVRFGALIAAARAERLSTIDAEAAETQARVEELEKAYMDKLARERAGELPGETGAQPPKP
jgi:N-methylhydantoinase A/oxoprolinase/acetone carboxylase beta subunit